MNTHHIHTPVGGWGLWPMIVLGVGIPFLLLLWLLHACVFVVGGGVVACICVFWCVVVCVFCVWCEFL